VLLQHAAARAGIRLVTINPSYLEREVTYVLRQSCSVGVFYASSFRGNDLGAIVAGIAPTLPDIRHTFSLDDWDAFADSANPSIDRDSSPSEQTSSWEPSPSIRCRFFTSAGAEPWNSAPSPVPAPTSSRLDLTLATY
jgi:acyl-CoA synthetase (AMP-forming)/AMP-acid ligase II